MGIKIVVPGVTFSDTSLPILRNDPLLVSGSLMLLDFGRDYTAPTGSVPANAAALGNLAWEEAVATIGSGSEATMKPTFNNTFVGVPAQGLVERTTKKGLHCITSITAMDANGGTGRHMAITMPTALRDYMFANMPSRSFYTSVWGRHTRLATQATDALMSFMSIASPSSVYANLLYRGAIWYPQSSTGFVGQRSVPAAEALGNFYAASAQNAWSVGTKPGAANLTENVFWVGARGAYESFQRNKAASAIIYRLYIEDLTTSGRSFATVDAADKALYDIDFGAGGRFASDSFTAASTVP
jgi:hypothetical protein